MKKIVLVLLYLFVSSNAGFSQAASTHCGTSRFDAEVFSNVEINNDVVYGSNTDWQGNPLTLTMDIYRPNGDVDSLRPLIIWAHGGSFMFGTKNDVDVVELSTRFAKRGYVCASINYRLGLLPNQASATQAVWRAVHDMKAAIRFFRKDAATANIYKIDPNMIFAGGSSAGAFTALQLAYMDEPSELPVAIDTILLGGLEGNSGNPGYQSTTNAVINLCGAVGDTTWMHAGDVPVCSMHGTNDIIVPYATSMLYLFGSIPILVVNGSYSINQHANSAGIPNSIYTFFGAQHVPYVNNAMFMDTTVRFISNFLYDYLGCTPSDPNPLPNTFVTTSIGNDLPLQNDFVIYPNPAKDRFVITSKNSSIQELEMTDLTGRVIRNIPLNGTTEVIIERDGLSQGIYFLKIHGREKTITQKICFE